MKKLFFGLLALGMIACSQVKEEGLEVVKVNVNSEDYLKTEAAFTNFEFVKLDTVSEALLSDVSKVLVGEDRLYVLPMRDARVFVFTKEGKYVNSLRKGQGPGEISWVYDMDLHDGNLYVYDNFRTIRKYDKDANYLEDVYSRDAYNFLMKIEDGQLLFFDPYMNRNQDKLMTVVSKDTTLTYFPKKEFVKTPYFANAFYADGYISWPLCDTIYRYQVEKMQPSPAYVVKFGHPSIYEAMQDGAITDEHLGKITKDDDYCKWLSSATVYGDNLFFSFKYDKLYYVKYAHGKARIYSKLIEGLPESKESIKGRVGNQLIYAYHMPDLMEYKVEMGEAPEGKLKDLFEQVTDEEDNPMLVFVTLE